MSDFFKDYSKMIEDMRPLLKSEENPFYNSGYVALSTVLDACKKAALANGFIFYQHLTVIDGKNALTTVLRHSSGTCIDSVVMLPYDAEIHVDKAGNQILEHNPQRLAASLTYFRRYSLTALFGIQEEDDDGNTASKKVKKEFRHEIECEHASFSTKKGVSKLGKDYTMFKCSDCESVSFDEGKTWKANNA